MKLLAASIGMSITAAALITSPVATATTPGAAAIGTVSAGTAVSGAFNVGSNGTSTSFAQNRESAMAKVTTSKGFTASSAPYCEQNVIANAAVLGSTKTTSAGVAYNISTGSGTGNALSSGQADTAARGTLGIQGVTSGFNGGTSGTNTDNLIKAAANQGSYVAGETKSGFEAKVQYKTAYGATPAPAPSHTGAVQVIGFNSGYASGANSSGALENMNAAGIANIGASGYFFGKTGLSGSTGRVTAP